MSYDFELEVMKDLRTMKQVDDVDNTGIKQRTDQYNKAVENPVFPPIPKEGLFPVISGNRWTVMFLTYTNYTNINLHLQERNTQK